MKLTLSSILFYLALLVGSAGCVSKGTADRRARDAFLAGQKQAAETALHTDSVWIVGNVANPIIPWTSDMTLVRAIIQAQYQSPGDPRHITVIRNGTSPFHFTAAQLLSGFDMPLKAGDKVELKQ
jgi:hypothetical protein